MNKYRAAFLPAALLLLALAPWPYAFYQVLQIVITGWAAFLAWDQLHLAKLWTPWAVGFMAVAVLFSAPIYSSGIIWMVSDLAGAIAFAAFAVIAPRATPRV